MSEYALTKPGINWEYYDPNRKKRLEQVYGEIIDAVPSSGTTGGAKTKTVGTGFQMPGFLTAGINDLKNNFGWNSATGAKILGKNMGGWTGPGTVGTGLMYGAQAIGNANDIADSRADANDLISDILRSSASNPLTNQFLTSDQTAMLNQLKRGTYDIDSNFTDFDLMGLLGGIGKGALSGGIIGGIPGAIVGGLGGGLNANLERQGQDQQNINAQLEGLYQALMDAESQYNSMRRPNFTGLGIQSRFQNMYN